MKHLVLSIVLFSASSLLLADSVDDLLKKANNAKNLSERMSLMEEAANQAAPDRKVLIYQDMLAFAERVKDQKNAERAARLLVELPQTPPELRGQALLKIYHAPSFQKNPYLSKRDHLRTILAIKDLSPATRLTTLKLALPLFAERDLKETLDCANQIIALPEATDYDRADTYINLAQVMLSLNRGKEGLEYVKKSLELPKIGPARKAQLFLIIGDFILKGSGYYYEPSEEDYKEAWAYWRKAIAIKGAKGVPGEAFAKIIESYKKKRMYDQLILECQAELDKKKDRIGSFGFCLTEIGHAKVILGDYQGAIEAFEKLRDVKYFIGDTCRFLGNAHFLAGNYVIALGCYAEALAALEGVEDSRPDWCKGWIARLTWEKDNEYRIADLIYKYNLRIAKEEGKDTSHLKPPVKPGSTAALFAPQSSKNKTTKGESAAESIGISDKGLDLDDL